MADTENDKRFAHIGKDPRFRKMKHQERKVGIDSRFQKMFHGKDFKMDYTMDKRGRPVQSSTKEDLKRFYELDSSDASSSSGSDEEHVKAQPQVKTQKTKVQERSVKKREGKLCQENNEKCEGRGESLKKLKKAVNLNADSHSRFGKILEYTLYSLHVLKKKSMTYDANFVCLWNRESLQRSSLLNL